jgi:hypothetical protein
MENFEAKYSESLLKFFLDYISNSHSLFEANKYHILTHIIFCLNAYFIIFYPNVLYFILNNSPLLYFPTNGIGHFKSTDEVFYYI